MRDAILLYYKTDGGDGKNLLLDATSGYACIDQLTLTGSRGEFSNDGLFYAADTGDVYSTDSWSVVYTETSVVKDLCFSEDSQFLVITSENPVTSVKLISTATWTVSDSFSTGIVGSAYFPSVALSPNNQWLVLGHSLGFVVWEVSTGNTVTLSFPFASGTGITDCAFSPNGDYLAISADYNIDNTKAFAVFDTTTFEVIETANLFVNEFGWIECLKFTPDGQYLVFGSYIYIALGDSYYIDGLAVMQTSNWRWKSDFEKVTDMVTHIDFHYSLPYMLITKENNITDSPYLIYDLETWTVIQEGKNIRYYDDKTVLLTIYSEPVVLQGVWAIYSKCPILKSLEGIVYDNPGEPISAMVSVLNDYNATERVITSSVSDGSYCFTYLYRDDKTLIALNPSDGNEVILANCQPF